MSETDYTGRLLYYLQQILSDRNIDRDRVRKDYRISIRTFQRDIRKLEELFAVQFIRKKDSSIYTLSREDRNRIIRHTGSSNKEQTVVHLEQIFSKQQLEYCSGLNCISDTELSLEEEEYRDFIYINRYPQPKNNLLAAVIEPLLKAARACNRVEFLYRHNRDGSDERVNGVPLLLVYREQCWYLFAEDETESIEKYAIGNIRRITSSPPLLRIKREEAARKERQGEIYRNKRERLRRQLEEAAGMLFSGEDERVEVRCCFESRVAVYFENCDYGCNQTITGKRDDGSITASFTFTSPYQCFFFLAPWLGYVTIMEAPEEYIEEIEWRLKRPLYRQTRIRK